MYGQLFEPQMDEVLRFDDASGMIAGNIPLLRPQPGQQAVQVVVRGIKGGESLVTQRLARRDGALRNALSRQRRRALPGRETPWER